MTRIETTTLIQAPLPQVFKFVSDWQKWEEWFEGVSDFKPRSGILTGNGVSYLPFPLATSWLDSLIMKPQGQKIFNKSFENLSQHFQ